MLIVLFGKNGQLGWELQRILPVLGQVLAFDYQELDLADLKALQTKLDELKPDLIVNASAYTAVDRAESERDLAMTINGRAPGIMAEAARKSGAMLVHYSTDYVFDGSKGSPYNEADAPNPLNVYGESKLAGEKAIQQVANAYLILRTSWVYSTRLHTGFVRKVLTWARQNEVLRIVKDQVGCPTWARLLAEVTGLLISRGGNQLSDFFNSYAGIGLSSMAFKILSLCSVVSDWEVTIALFPYSPAIFFEVHIIKPVFAKPGDCRNQTRSGADFRR